MRVAIVGAGAMGTLLGHGFCKGGHEVTVIDLPERVSQLESTGKLAVVSPDGSESEVTPYQITSDYEHPGQQNIVILATKSQDLPAVAQNVNSILGGEPTVVTIQNGIPWWYLQTLPQPFGDARITCLDPDGVLEKNFAPSSIVGCVAYPAATLDANGRAHHIEGFRFPVGEVAGAARERTHIVANLFESSGFKSRVIDDIRSEIWLKAWGALSINPVSALTGATMEQICSYKETRNLIAEMMREAQDVAEALGATFRHTIEKRIEGARAVGAHKTSMLQDVERGRALELDGLMVAVLELAELVDKQVPAIRNVYACTALLNESLIALHAQSREKVS